MIGDPQESERLIPLFMAFVGNRSVAQVCRFYSLPYLTITAWTRGRSVLACDLQQRMRGDLGLGAP